jgi:predicted nucleic acid-binding Zn ribbon protein
MSEFEPAKERGGMPPTNNGCPACGAANPPDARFCGDCGADLTRAVCAACGAISPVGKRFCNSCGARLEAQTQIAEPVARPAEAGERKQVAGASPGAGRDG